MFAQRVTTHAPRKSHTALTPRTAATLPPISTTSSTDRPILRRKCACGGSSSSEGECGDCKKKKSLQRAASSHHAPATAPPIVHDVLQSSGSPLDSASRAFFEPRFGVDFSRVRIHADSRAAQSARAVNAIAYTAGRDIVFDTGRFSPSTPAGRQLIAHELTHIVQQRFRNASTDDITHIGPVADAHEQQADRVAATINTSHHDTPATSPLPSSSGSGPR